MQSVQAIETRRLKLRWLTLDDAEFMLSIWNDPAFVRNVGDRGIRTADDARQALSDGALKLYNEYGYGPYRIDLRGSETAIGVCGLFRRDGLDDADLGFALLPEFCGRGYAHEAAVAVFDHARNGLRLPRLTAIVSPGNAASIGLIEKLGLAFERTLQLSDDEEPVSLYAIEFHRA